MSSIIDLTPETIKRVMEIEANIAYDLLVTKHTLSKDQMAEAIYDIMCQEEKRAYHNEERKSGMQ